MAFLEGKHGVPVCRFLRRDLNLDDQISGFLYYFCRLFPAQQLKTGEGFFGKARIISNS
jgi:hypothetical protein